MLVEKKCVDNQECIYMEFNNIEKDFLCFLENIAYEYRCKIEKKEWRSKYNNYVVYDYEPFCSDGFEITLTLSSKSMCFLNFVKFLYDKKVQKINYLNTCVAM